MFATSMASVAAGNQKNWFSDTTVIIRILFCVVAAVNVYAAKGANAPNGTRRTRTSRGFAEKMNTGGSDIHRACGVQYALIYSVPPNPLTEPWAALIFLVGQMGPGRSSWYPGLNAACRRKVRRATRATVSNDPSDKDMGAR